MCWLCVIEDLGEAKFLNEQKIRHNGYIQWVRICLNNSLFICVYFEGSPSAEELSGVMRGELSQFYMFSHSHGIFLKKEMRKNGGNKKRIVYARGCSCTRAFALGLGTPLGSCLGVPIPHETCSFENLPYNVIM
jgi:hypothetical protein